MGRGGGSSSGSSSSSSSGRSFSSSSGRSFSGRSSSSSRGGSSRSSSSSRGGYSPRPAYRPSTTRVNHYHYGSGGYYGRRSGGILSVFVTMLILVVALAVVFSMFRVNTGSISRSTLERTAIQPAGPFDRDCIDDRADWIKDSATLLRGMESFYKATGIQPAICITESLDGQSPEAYASARYDELIGHEKGLLLLFFEPVPSDWDAYQMSGRAAQTIMDTEACDILLDYVEAYYTSDMTEDEYFAAVFRETGERIMAVTPTLASRIPVIVCGAVVVAFIAGSVLIVKSKHKREREQAEETERLLNTHVDRL